MNCQGKKNCHQNLEPTLINSSNDHRKKMGIVSDFEAPFSRSTVDDICPILTVKVIIGILHKVTIPFLIGSVLKDQTKKF